MFVMLLEYTAPIEEVDTHLPAHRTHLAECYEAGLFLLSGRQDPLVGGVILSNGTRDQIEAVAAADPFVQHGVARYRIVEFHPTRLADDLAPVLAGRGVTT